MVGGDDNRGSLYLGWEVMSDIERSTVTGLENLLPLCPAHTVRPELPGLTPGDLLSQPNKLLRHLDVLDSSEGVVALPRQH